MAGVRALLHALLGVAVGLLWGWSLAAAPRSVAAPASNLPTTEMVRNLSELTTLRIDVADVQVASISGWWGCVEAALLVRGDLDLSTDLGAARFEAVDPSTRTAVLILPSPVASPPRLDHAGRDWCWSGSTDSGGFFRAMRRTLR